MSLLMSTTSTEIVQLGVGTSLHLQLSTKEVTTTSGIANIANDVKCMENANGSRHGNSHNLVQHAQDSLAGLLLVGTKALASEGSSYAATRSGNCRGCRTRKKNWEDLSCLSFSFWQGWQGLLISLWQTWFRGRSWKILHPCHGLSWTIWDRLPVTCHGPWPIPTASGRTEELSLATCRPKLQELRKPLDAQNTWVTWQHMATYGN